MGRFALEILILNILQAHYERSEDEFWELERFKNAFEKASQFYDDLLVLGKYKKRFENE